MPFRWSRVRQNVNLSSMSEEACRIDVWLWRARFFKTRSQAGRFVEDGRVRLTSRSETSRIDKPSRAVKPGDAVVFAFGGRIVAVRILALGDRRGPPVEARGLYRPLDDSPP
jgi:ribosome-associated heat shock protein Hsp15